MSETFTEEKIHAVYPGVCLVTMRYVFVYVTLWMMCLVDAAPTWSTTDAIGVPSPRTYGNGLAEGERKRIAKFRADAAKEAFEFAWSGYSKCVSPCLKADRISYSQ